MTIQLNYLHRSSFEFHLTSSIVDRQQPCHCTDFTQQMSNCIYFFNIRLLLFLGNFPSENKTPLSKKK